jgi:DNA-directed RNA polymerase subunit K/omega
MNVKTVHMKDIFKQNDDLYTSAMIIAKRAKQIIDDRVVPIDENEEVEDSMEFEQPIITTYEEKPEAIALKEFIEGKLDWRIIDVEDETVDE